MALDRVQVLKTAAAVLATAAGVGMTASVAWTTSLPPVVVRVAFHRSVTSVAPSWTYAEVAARFMPLVAEPACPPPDGGSAAYLGDAVADCKVVGARVLLAPRATAERDGRAIGPWDLQDGLEHINEGSTATNKVRFEARDGELFLTPPPDMDAISLQQVLSQTPVAWWSEKEPCTLTGTGPFRVVDVVVQSARKAADPRHDLSPCLVGSEETLGPRVTDRVRLRERRGGRTVEFYGYATSDDEDAAVAQARLDAGELAVVFPWSDAGDDHPGTRAFRQDNRTLYLVFNPDPERLPLDRATVLSAFFRSLLADPNIQRDLGVVAAPGPFQDGASSYGWPLVDPRAPSPPCGESLVLLTNPGWEDKADTLLRYANDAAGCTDEDSLFTVRVLPPDQEGTTRRTDGDYDISLLANVAFTLDGPVYFVDGLGAWFRDGHEPLIDCAGSDRLPATQCGRRLVSARGSAETAGPDWARTFDAFVDATTPWLVTVGHAPVYGGMSSRLRGFEALTGRIDPSILALEPERGDLVARLAVGLTLCFGGIGSLLLDQRARRERARLAMLRHDLEAPFKTLVAFASLLDEGSRSLGAAISDEVGRVRARILALSQSLGAAPPPTAGVDVWEQAAEPALRALRARAAAQGLVDVVIEGVPGPEALRSALSTGAARTALDNLLDNALKYRCGDTLRVRVEAIPRPDHAVLLVSDEGEGLNPAELTWISGHRGSGALRSGVPGEGLGLASARALLRAEGGDLELASARGPTSFRILLPYGRMRGGDARPDGR